jgi:hypothetical protein
MKHRVMAVLLVAGLLGGCTEADWDSAFAYAGLGPSKPDSASSQSAPDGPSYTAAPAASVTNGPAPVADTWCIDVAKSAQLEAAQQGFDGATQRRRAMTTFNQCSRNRAQ